MTLEGFPKYIPVSDITMSDTHNRVLSHVGIPNDRYQQKLQHLNELLNFQIRMLGLVSLRNYSLQALESLHLDFLSVEGEKGCIYQYQASKSKCNRAKLPSET